MFGTRSLEKVYNFVHRDEIWKDHAIRELQSQNKWFEKWGYLFDEYKKLQQNLLNIGCERAEDFENELAQKIDLSSKNCTEFVLKNSGKVDVVIDEKNCCISSAEIQKHIARLQENVRGKNDILKLLRWPQEGMI